MRATKRRKPGLNFEMSVALNHPVQPTLLHITSSSLIESPEAFAVEQWIEQAGLEVVRCPDVYLGLARALRSSQRDFGAVMVCVEDLLTDEFEFFSLVARMRRDLPVFVYGSQAPERVVRALQSGAKGLATRDAVLALGARFERLAQPAESALAAPSVTPSPFAEQSKPTDAFKACSVSVSAHETAAPSPSMSLMKPDLVCDPAEVQTEEREVEPREEAGPVATARVPWLRYNVGPARQRPTTAKVEREETSSIGGTHDTEASNGRPPNECKREYEPLLTEQELAALLGDDLDDVALQEREMLTGEGEVPGSGTR